MSSFYHPQSGKTVYVGGGIPGRSAYEEAVARGFAGTEAEWLAALRGPPGPKGEDGATGAQGEPGADGPPGPVTSALPLLPVTPFRIVRAGDTLICQPSVWPEGQELSRGYQWLRDGMPVAWATATSYERTAADQDCSLACEEVVTLDGITVALMSNSVFFALPSVIAGGPYVSPELVAPPGIVELGDRTWQITRGVWIGEPAPQVTGYLFLGGEDRTADLDGDLRIVVNPDEAGMLLWIEIAANIAGSASVRVTAAVTETPGTSGWNVQVIGGDIVILSAPPAPALPPAPAVIVDGQNIMVTE